ncbi:MAG: hypothetical protein AAF750_03765 [Planctomycetota bacterium]
MTETPEMIRRSSIALVAACLTQHAAAGPPHPPTEPARPSADRPVIHTQFFVRNPGDGGRIPRQLFWNESFLADQVDEAAAANKASHAQGLTPTLGLMMWSDAYFTGEPGADRSFSDDAAYNAYWRWNRDRHHYFARRPDGQIWSRRYTEAGEPKDAWITPSRPLDERDRSPGVTTYGDWYAQRIADRAAAIGVRGVLLADHADQIAHGNALDQDFSDEVIADFQKWSGIDLPGETTADRANAILSEHTPQWIDYLSNVYGAWWLDMVGRINQATGDDDAMILMQKHAFPHWSRYSAADAIWMRKNADKAAQIAYHVESWSMPSPRGGAIGNGEISAYVGQVGAHLSREPDITRGVFVPVTKFASYPGPGKGTGIDHYWAIDTAERQHALTLSDDEKTEMQKKIQLGAWLALGWIHLANHDGGVERAAMYFFTHRERFENPYDVFESAIRPINPQRPIGPAFYYSTSTERAFEHRSEKWNPLEKMPGFAKRGADGHVMLAYFVSDQTLDTLQPSSHPTAWVIDELDTLGEDERQRLEAIAPVYSIDDAAGLPTTLTPVRVRGDATGFAFADEEDRLILYVTRDHVINNTDITAEVVIQGFADGEHVARDVVSGEELPFTIVDGVGTLQVSLPRWSSRGFRTTVRTD